MQDDSSALAGRWAEVIFVFDSLVLAVSTIISEQEGKHQQSRETLQESRALEAEGDEASTTVLPGQWRLQPQP